MEGFSLSWLRREREEIRRDRHAFAACLDILQKRILESNETEIPRRPLLHQWSGTRAVVGTLELSLHAIERTIQEMDQLIQDVESGKIPDLDAPQKETPGGMN